MNCIIPFTKDIKFNTNIAEVLSISLEHDYTVNESELLGNLNILKLPTNNVVKDFTGVNINKAIKYPWIYTI